MGRTAQEPDNGEFIEWLKKAAGDRGLSLHKLAMLCDLNQIYFYQSINKNKTAPPPKVLRLAAPHLRVPYVDVMIAAGYLTEEDIHQWQEAKEQPNLHLVQNAGGTV